jgi:hypothetical protein
MTEAKVSDSLRALSQSLAKAVERVSHAVVAINAPCAYLQSVVSFRIVPYFLLECLKNATTTSLSLTLVIQAAHG